MENNFHLLEEDKIAPPQIKKEVDGSLGLARFLGEVIDLYLGKSSKVITGFMKDFGKTKRK